MAKAPSKFAAGLKKKKRPDSAASTSAHKPRFTPGSGGRERKKIGQILIDFGFISEEQLWQILDQHRQTGERTGKTALDMQLITEDMLTQALAEQQGAKTADLKNPEFKPTDKALETVPETMCSLYKILPIKFENNVLTLVMADPTNLAAIDDLRNMLSIDEIETLVGGENEVAAAIERFYAAKSESIEDIIKSMETDEDLAAASAGAGVSVDLETLEDLAEAAPVRKLLNMVLLLAIRDKASDIHLEPFEDEFKMRYRVDGVMYEMVPPPRHLAPAISSRVKVMANLDIAERRLPQDGRIELNIGGNPVDLRVSVLPTMFGEGIVMRVLDRTVVSLDLNKVGMPSRILAEFRELINRPHGIVLVTGPTGSGKTTTLYSALNELNDIGVKIITTEDPIEYDIEGIVQVPINSEIGVTFAACLRSILRQDPDIILVGEMRDFETAQIGVQASLTGHLVFSTLHTNDAVGAVTRLRDMGIPPFLITATIEGVLAQRLVRKICVDCREEFTPSQELLMELAITKDKAQGRRFYHGRGCDRCNNTGHKGRSGLFELFVLNDELREMIMEGSVKDKLTQAARRSGMYSLRDAGLKAIFEGITTIDEVVRETVLDEEG